MRKTTLRVPVADRPEPTVITLSFRDDLADLSPTAGRPHRRVRALTRDGHPVDLAIADPGR